MWQRHWKLSSDPFTEGRRLFVTTPVHAEAVARLIHAIETHQRRAHLQAPAGLGKSMVLAQALAQARAPHRRVALVSSPCDGPSLLADLAEGLGLRVQAGASRAQAWRRLTDAVRVCHWQRLSVVLAIDDCQNLTDPSDRLDLARLVHLAPGSDARLTVILSERSLDEPPSPAEWIVPIRLAPLSRSEAERYLTAKMAAAGRGDPAFSPRALARLHALSAGNPRGLDRLATQSLMAGALRGVQIVSPEIVEDAAPECCAVG